MDRLTPDDFITTVHDDRTFPFFEDENGNGVYGYGHTDKAEFATAVNKYDRYVGGVVSNYFAGDVLHGYITPSPDNPGLFRVVRELPVPADATPITWVPR